MFRVSHDRLQISTRGLEVKKSMIFSKTKIQENVKYFPYPNTVLSNTLNLFQVHFSAARYFKSFTIQDILFTMANVTHATKQALSAWQ